METRSGRRPGSTVAGPSNGPPTSPPEAAAASFTTLRATALRSVALLRLARKGGVVVGGSAALEVEVGVPRLILETEVGVPRPLLEGEVGAPRPPLLLVPRVRGARSLAAPQAPLRRVVARRRRGGVGAEPPPTLMRMSAPMRMRGARSLLVPPRARVPAPPLLPGDRVCTRALRLAPSGWRAHLAGCLGDYGPLSVFAKEERIEPPRARHFASRSAVPRLLH